MKKIAIVSYDVMPLPPVKGGAVENLIHFLVENNEVEKKAELTVFSVYDPDALKESKNYKNTEFVHIHKREKMSAITSFTNRVFKKLRFGAAFQVHPFLIDVTKVINQRDFDYVLVENRAEYVPYLRKKVKSKILLHMHNDYLCKTYHLADPCLKGCDQVFAVSNYIKDRILTIDPKAKHVEVLRNVVDVERFMQVTPEERNRIRDGYNIESTDVVFAYFGRITPSKGVRELVQAFLQLTKRHSNVKLLVVGAKWFGVNTENAFMQELRELSQEVEDKIIFTGYVDYNSIAQQYACADVVVVPSVGGEASPLVLLEAMAAGKAQIVSDSGGIPESVDDSCAIEVPRGDGFVDGLAAAMDRLTSDRALLESMGQSGKNRSHMYDNKQYLNSLLQLLEE